jgi:hypothetical protein
VESDGAVLLDVFNLRLQSIYGITGFGRLQA